MGRGAVALIVDNPKRDLDGLLLVALHLVRRGVRVFLAPMYEQGYDIPRLRPAVVVANYARPQNRALIAGYRALGCVTCVLDAEGGILSHAGRNAPRTWAQAFRDDGWTELIDDYFFWGSAVRDAFAAYAGMARGRLHLTGCPRYDLCVSPWDEALGRDVRSYVLINTNFPAINPRFTGSEEVERKLFLEGGWDFAYVERLFREWKIVFPRYLEAVGELARRCPQRRILVRPHPFERADPYVEHFSGLSNVTVSGEGNVLSVIRRADCVIHLNCGTAVEANLMGRDPLSMEFLNSEFLRLHSPLPSEISIPARDVEDLCHLVEDAKARTRRVPLRAERLRRLEPWFHRPDGRAAERVAEVLEKLAHRGRKCSRSLAAVVRGTRQGASLAQRAQGMSCLLFGSYAVNRARAWFVVQRREKALRASAAQARIAELARAGGLEVPRVRRARSGTGIPLASLEVLPAEGAGAS